MLFEWLRYISSPCPKYLDEMGYLKELIGLESRWIRCQKYWESHLSQTRDTIVQHIEREKSHRKILIIGSGLLYDVPIELLSKTFDEVILLDILHLPFVRKKMKKYPNVRLVEQDITDVAQICYHTAKQSKSKTNAPAIPAPIHFLDDENIDFVVSLNILSQLPLLPKQFLEKICDEMELEKFGKDLMSAHISYLRRFRCPVLMICDAERQIFDKKGTLIDRENVLEGSILNNTGEEWLWNIAPIGEIHKDYSVVHKVLAVRM